ncbi:hypothetical protein NFI96_005977 [Prochilodus magdalenae]|nr:hypothetical protein NFI96_005977 [Prochilodus magdalenae]
MKKVQAALLKLKEIYPEYRDISLRSEAECESLETMACEEMADSDRENHMVPSTTEPRQESPVEVNTDAPTHQQDEFSDLEFEDWEIDSADGTLRNGGPVGGLQYQEEGNADLENLAEEQQENEGQNYGITFDSCLQPADVGQEILSFGENIYSIAPAEGNQPASFFRTPYLEAMPFPVQFNTGRNTLDEPDRPKKISPSRYDNARLLSVDNRFAMDTTYIFFAQFVTEMHLAMSSMSIQLRKGKVFTKDGRKINAALLKDRC